MGELEAAVKTDKRLRFGLYYSLFEWFHPLYNNDEKNNFSTSDFVTAKMLPELTELVMKYKVGAEPQNLKSISPDPDLTCSSQTSCGLTARPGRT